jgi:uncharacterized RDD family membrane protein YckC
MGNFTTTSATAVLLDLFCVCLVCFVAMQTVFVLRTKDIITGPMTFYLPLVLTLR